jgi:hypothetical protein
VSAGLHRMPAFQHHRVGRACRRAGQGALHMQRAPLRAASGARRCQCDSGRTRWAMER